YTPLFRSQALVVGLAPVEKAQALAQLFQIWSDVLEQVLEFLFVAHFDLVLYSAQKKSAAGRASSKEGGQRRSVLQALCPARQSRSPQGAEPTAFSFYRIAPARTTPHAVGSGACAARPVAPT